MMTRRENPSRNSEHEPPVKTLTFPGTIPWIRDVAGNPSIVANDVIEFPLITCHANISDDQHELCVDVSFPTTTDTLNRHLFEEGE